MESFEEHFEFSLKTPFLGGQVFSDLEIVCKNKLPSVYPQNTIVDLKILPLYNNHLQTIIDMLVALNSHKYGLM